MTSIPETLRNGLGTFVRRSRAVLGQISGRSARERASLDGQRAVILMYHRVLPRAQAHSERVEDGMFVDPATFGRHLDWLAADFSVMPLAAIVDDLEAGRVLPEKACAITFDDGWYDNLVHGLPELEKRQMPATLFAVSDRVGTRGGFWPDEMERRLAQAAPATRADLASEIGLAGAATDPAAFLEFLKGISETARPALLERIRAVTTDALADRRELMNWEELDRLAAANIDIEVHGASHAILTGLDASGIRSELSRSLESLRAKGHARHTLLAYPSGAYDEEVVSIARELGYRAAVTTEPGLASAEVDLLKLPRVGIHDDISRTHAEFLRFVPGAH
jgi:peptidoglycan/xylan/chitin deacetylase (PgdA/CDA1 family)